MIFNDTGATRNLTIDNGMLRRSLSLELDSNVERAACQAAKTPKNIHIIGGSMSIGHGLSRRNSAWPHLVADALGQSAVNITVQNLAKPRVGTKDWLHDEQTWRDWTSPRKKLNRALAKT